MEIVLRDYQKRIVDKIINDNTIVVLPTGSGKTLIAAECVKKMKCITLFLVPTCLLVSQQANVFRLYTGLNVVEYMGGLVLPTSFDVLVSTPQAFLSALNTVLAWKSFGLVIFDEVHHVIKRHPYRHIAQSIRLSSSSLSLSSMRIVGLTASLTYEVASEAIEKQINGICSELNITNIETASNMELQQSGYHASLIPMEINLPILDNYDGLVVSFADRKPHLVYETFFNRIEKGVATSYSMKLVDIIRRLEAVCQSLYPSYVSPLYKQNLSEWGKYAHSFGNSSHCKELVNWYESLRLLINGWEETEDASVMFLRMTININNHNNWSINNNSSTTKLRDDFLQEISSKHYPRYNNLIKILEFKLDSLIDFRGILFVNQRVSTHILQYVIMSNPSLASRLRTACIYAADSPATPSLSLTKKEIANRIKQFSNGDINLLIATVTAEEGMDIPSANCVIRFDPMVNSVSLVQGRGRARQAGSSFIVLSERPDRPASSLASIAASQLDIISNKRQRTTTVNNSDDDDDDDDDSKTVLYEEQINREKSAYSTLINSSSSLSTLNIYCQKTKASLLESYTNINTATTNTNASSSSNGNWSCKLIYKSSIRSVTSNIISTTKKDAKQKAAVSIIQKLINNDNDNDNDDNSFSSDLSKKCLI